MMNIIGIVFWLLWLSMFLHYIFHNHLIKGSMRFIWLGALTITAPVGTIFYFFMIFLKVGNSEQLQIENKEQENA